MGPVQPSIQPVKNPHKAHKDPSAKIRFKNSKRFCEKIQRRVLRTFGQNPFERLGVYEIEQTF